VSIDPYIAPFVFGLMVAEVIYALCAGRRLFSVGDSIANVQLGLLQRTVHALLDGAFLAIYILVYEHWSLFRIPTDSIVALIALVVGIDFVFYFYHRFSHRVNLAWAAHAVHHQSEEFNLTVGFRISSTSIPIRWMFHYPFALLGFHPAVFFPVLVLSTAYQIWYHTRVVRSLGWLDGILVTPSNHRVHHGINPQYIDKNYGGMFIVWDRLFGTFEPEREPVVYGVRRPLRSLNPVWALAEGYWKLATESRAANGLRQRLGVWLGPPEALPERGDGAPPGTREKYSVRPQRAVLVYVLVQMLVLVPVTVAVVRAHAQLGIVLTGVAAAGMALSFAALSGLLEEKPWAARLELSRLVAVTAILAVLHASLPATLAGAVLLAVAAASIVAFLLLAHRGALTRAQP
jgi:sterol desaturase/sphingolipid hydroxylase (fatty acid hydroxylase superfamily)